MPDKRSSLADAGRAWETHAAMLLDRILFLDGEALVLDKPAGLPVTQVRDGSLSLENHLDSLRFGFRRFPSSVHRLDRDTSGCLLLARNPKAHARFSAAFEAGEVEKDYLAVVEGVPAEASGTVSLALAKISSAAAGWRIVPDPRGKPAVTEWTMLEARDGRALLRLRPRTGRTHQLRVHVASGLGMPIVGDAMYGRGGGGPGSGQGMLLHAARLVLPRGSKPAIDATAPLPASFGEFGRMPADAAA